MMKTITQLSLIIYLIILCPFTGKSQVLPGNLPGYLSIAVSSGTGNWNNSGTWTWLVNNGNQQGPLTVPNDSTFVIIQSGHTVTLTANSKCESIVVEPNATLDNSTFELKLQLMGWAHPVNDVDYDDGVPYLSFAPIDGTWSIYNTNNAHWTMYKVDGTHTGSGNTIFDWDDGIDRDEFGATITGSGTISTIGSIYYRSSGGVQRGLKFNSACDLNFYCDLNLTDDEYPVNGGGGLTAVNYGTINMMGTANFVTGAEYGVFFNNSGANIVLNNGSLYLAPLTAYTTFFSNSGLVEVQNGNLYFSLYSYIQTDGGSIVINGSVLGQDLDSYFLQGAGSILSVTGEIFPSSNPGRFISLVGPNYVIYNGTSPQQIMAPTDPLDYVSPGPYSILMIDNPAGALLNSDIPIQDSLILSNGLLNIGNYNLTLGQDAAIGGDPSASSMIVATGSGKLRKVFIAPESFTFPVGDNDAIAEYSPVTLNFTTGTFGDANVGVNLVNQPYPGVTGSYLKRYWNITSSGITGFTCDAQFNYVPDDVTGNEDSLYCFRVDPTTDLYDLTNAILHHLTATGLTSFGTFTGKQQDRLPLAYTVTGAGSYCMGGDGTPVGLSGSQLGVTYTLFKDAVAQTPTVEGTGEIISFGNQLIGTYTVTGENNLGVVDMIGDAVITEGTSLPVSVTILADQNPVCDGSWVTFTATTVNGGTPVYEWFVNEVSSGNNSPVFSYVPVNNDVVYVVITSSLECVINNPAQSNLLVTDVTDPVEVTVSIEADQNNVCAGTPVLFTATMVNGGDSPNYLWFVNGNAAGTNSPEFSYIPADGDEVHVLAESSLECVVESQVESNTVVIETNQPLEVSATIVADQATVCAGTLVNFTASSINGGNNPSYQWFVNGELSGTNSPVFSYIPANTDVVYAVITSSLECVSNNPAQSNTIEMDVTEPAEVSVTIEVDLNNICTGTQSTFTATPVNGGDTPVYQWFVNGNLSGSGDTYSHIPENGDLVYVTLTSSMICVTGNPAQSNIIQMLVSVVVEVTNTIAVQQNNLCDGSEFGFTSSTSGGGAQPGYQWLVNDVPAGESTPEFAYIAENGDVVSMVFTSSLSCADQNQVTSNTITAVVNPLPAVSWPGFEPDTLCIEDWEPVTLTGGTPVGGTYSGDGVVGNTFDPSLAGAGSHEITYTYSDSNGCSNQSSLVLFVNVCLGMSEKESGLLVYPNPASDYLMVKMKDNSSIQQITLTNMLGIRVYQNDNPDSPEMISIAVQNIPAGNYLLRVVSTNQTIFKTVIIK
jgi:hypothetical protein